MQKEVKEQLRNPINGAVVDEIIKEKEARQRGYFDLQFLLRYLEDDNEFVKYFIIDGKKIVVDLEKPYLQYKKPTQINHDRVIPEAKSETQEDKLPTVPTDCCSVDPGECLSCGS